MGGCWRGKQGPDFEGSDWHTEGLEQDRVGTGEPQKVSEQGRPVTVIGIRGRQSAGQSVDLGRMTGALERKAGGVL